jgi:predicted DNA-binding transcriptional regulator AlpA
MDKQTQPPAETWLGLMASKEIVTTVKISRAHLHALVREKRFPAPALRIGPRYTRWKASDVQAWLADPQGWQGAHTESAVTA